MKKKIPHLDEDALFDLAKGAQVQHAQLFDLSGEAQEISNHLDLLEKKEFQNAATGKALLSELESLMQELDSADLSGDKQSEIEEAFTIYEKMHDAADPVQRYDIRKAREVFTNHCWESYFSNLNEYAGEIGLDDSEDPFLASLGESAYQDLRESIDGQFAQKTSIKNKRDLRFLAIAVALEVAKGLLYPVLAAKAGFGEGFDSKDRLAHDDPSIKEKQKKAAEAYESKHKPKSGTVRWTDFLTQPVPYDITAGTGAMADLNLHGGDHRLYTLGHDPILGWIFGTANIMTDVISVAPGAVVSPSGAQNKIAQLAKAVTMRSYRVSRVPSPCVTPERVPLPELFQESYEVSQADLMNLPAAVFTQAQHLKSDINTKKGLPIPVVEMFSPDLAGKLYHDNYDVLCLARDLKIIGASAGISILIDALIGLVHGMYYDPEKDGSRDMYEVRTRKILLVANTIGTSSNLISIIFTKNLKGLDIGGLLVTLSHLFLDTRFFLRVKKEFLENRIYEKIDTGMKELDRIEQELVQYGYQHRALY